ncbi:MAG: hypothetical protein ABI577_03995 [bacterium]
MQSPHVVAALELARARHNAIREEDLERYAASEDELIKHCAVLGMVDPLRQSLEDRAALDELMALETASLRIVERMSVDVSGRLAELAARSRTNSAYLRSERSSVNAL